VSGGGAVIGIALIGAGVIGRIHARNVAANPGCALRWVVDRDIGRAETLTSAFGGRATDDIARALADDGVEAVIIGSSTSAHHEHLMACIAAGKPTLCEKPVSDDLDDARRCIEAAAAARVPVAVGFNRRYDVHHRAVHRRIRDGEIGKVEMLHLVSRTNPPLPAPETVRHSGGMLREKGAHHYDLAAWMAAAEPLEVFAAGDCLVDPGYAAYGDVDTAVLTLRFDNGALATFSFSRRAAHGFEEMIEVFGSEGMIESRRQPALGVALWKASTVTEVGLHGGWFERFAQTYVDELQHFLQLAAGKPAEIATLSDGVRAQAVAEAAIVSLRQGALRRIAKIW